MKSDSFLLYQLQKKKDNSLYSVSFPTKDIIKVRNNLDSTKAVSHVEISTRMLNLCGSPFQDH